MSRILVTGGTGFVGVAFVEAALARGHQVAVLVRDPRRLPPGVIGLPGSLAEPPWDEIAAHDPECCLLGAWTTEPGSYLTSASNMQYLAWSKDWVDGLLRLGMRRIVGVGTCLEYAPAPGPLSESRSAIEPHTPYAECKHALNRHIEIVVPRAGASWAWCRLFYIYGRGERPERLCSATTTTLAAGQPVLLNSGASVRDYIHVRDAARGLLAVMESSHDGVVNVGTGTGVAVLDIAQTLAAIMGRTRPDIRDRRVPDPHPCMVADASRLRALGWSPAVPLRGGLEDLVQAVVA